MWDSFVENPQLRPFEEVLKSFCERLSQILFAEADPRQYPEIVALAFWLRKSHIETLEERFRSLENTSQILVPRGLAFHIAPANVETLFVYSWILSLLVGNSNVVRLPSRESPATSLLFGILKRLLNEKAFETISKSTLLLFYGHEEDVTAAISAKADLRLIWGGDATIQTIRKIPVKITGQELLFADRYAYAAIHSSSYLESDEEKQQKNAELIFRDIFWYDQQTCASPRTIFWIGSNEHSREASVNLYQRLQKIAKMRGYAVPLSARLNKMTEVYRAAIVLPVTELRQYGALTVLDLEEFGPACRTFGGNGLLFSVVIPNILQIAQYAHQKDQTLVHAGFAQEELRDLAATLNGKGLDRIVPVGNALQFDAVWDGYDLLAALTKKVTIE
ncbi:MAG: hypothetical protein LLG04_11035 [Parachlamydia sp.]|nr:hypothetical protein [Parachlamydia sp.]